MFRYLSFTITHCVLIENILSQYGNPPAMFQDQSSWEEMKVYIGDGNKEYWIGLDNLHRLTNRPGVEYELKESHITSVQHGDMHH